MAKHLKIKGLVQGVGFRDAMCREADRLGVTGWVRNCRDGSVEAIVDGAPSAVDGIIAWARRGPPAARRRAPLFPVFMQLFFFPIRYDS